MYSIVQYMYGKVANFYVFIEKFSMCICFCTPNDIDKRTLTRGESLKFLLILPAHSMSPCRHRRYTHEHTHTHTRNSCAFEYAWSKNIARCLQHVLVCASLSDSCDYKKESRLSSNRSQVLTSKARTHVFVYLALSVVPTPGAFVT